MDAVWDAGELARRLDAAGDDETARHSVWVELVHAVGAPAASKLWLDHFAATDAPVTG